MFTQTNIIKQIELWNEQNLTHKEIDLIFEELMPESINKSIQHVKTTESIPYYYNLRALCIVTVFKEKSIIYDTVQKKFFFEHIEDYLINNNLTDIIL